MTAGREVLKIQVSLREHNMRPTFVYPIFLMLPAVLANATFADDWSLADNPNLADYFEAEVSKIEKQNSLFKYKTLAEWEAAKTKLQSQLHEMLGLSPLPAKTELHPQVTGVTQHEDFRVEKLHFQSSPGLYVTANLYLPNTVDKPLPTVLYVCGHAKVKDGDVSFGNKVGYQHHGAWFARNGYACLTIDTLQLGEIEGIHHGTYKYNRWWWNARGYTPAGVEAWNCIRALDYLQTRPEIDSDRFAVTGRSGGGAYSWWIAALDERIKCAVPVAGIATVRNHVVEGCIEGHCDCMFMVNKYRWDYATVAALVAPRPLLISNTDKDRIFPLHGVVEVHRQVRHIYDLYKQPNHLGLQITEGPHKDTQELRIHAFRWINRWLKQDETLITMAAEKLFEPQQLQVFADLPKNERNTTIDEHFVPPVAQADDAAERILKDCDQWVSDTRRELNSLMPLASSGPAKDFAFAEKRQPQNPRPELGLAKNRTQITFITRDGMQLGIDICCEEKDPYRSRDKLFFAGEKAVMFVIDSDQYQQLQKLSGPSYHAAEKYLNAGAGVIFFSPRGHGSNSWNGNAKKQIQIRRRFQMIGRTWDAEAIVDIRECMQTLRKMFADDVNFELHADGTLGWHTAVAAGLEGEFKTLRLQNPGDNRSAYPVLGLGTEFDPLEILAFAAIKQPVVLSNCSPELVKFAESVSGDSRWTGRSITAE